MYNFLLKSDFLGLQSLRFPLVFIVSLFLKTSCWTSSSQFISASLELKAFQEAPWVPEESYQLLVEFHQSCSRSVLHLNPTFKSSLSVTWFHLSSWYGLPQQFLILSKVHPFRKQLQRKVAFCRVLCFLLCLQREIHTGYTVINIIVHYTGITYRDRYPWVPENKYSYSVFKIWYRCIPTNLEGKHRKWRSVLHWYLHRITFMSLFSRGRIQSEVTLDDIWSCIGRGPAAGADCGFIDNIQALQET